MFPAVARRRGGRPVRTCHLRMSARLAFIFRPMESFTLWAGGTPVMSSSLILSSMIPAATVGQPSQPVTPTPLRTTWLAAYSPSLGHRTFTAWAVPISPARPSPVASSAMTLLLTASPAFLVTGRLVTRALCRVASRFSTTSSTS